MYSALKTLAISLVGVKERREGGKGERNEERERERVRLSPCTRSSSPVHTWRHKVLSKTRESRGSNSIAGNVILLSFLGQGVCESYQP